MSQAINWGLANNAQSAFSNALANGLQMGRAIREAQERKEYRSALGVLATDPGKQNALTAVFQHNPQVGVSLMNRAEDSAFGQDAAAMMSVGGQPNALLGLSSSQANSVPPGAAQPQESAAPSEPDLSVLGEPQDDADRAFLRMVRRDPMKALEIRSAMRDNFVGQAEAESEFYGFAMGELSRATDQASWTAGLRAIMPRARALNLNIMQHVPREYPGPDGVRQLMERAQPIKDQLDLLVREANIEADNVRADRNTDSLIETRDRRATEYERHNRASESNQRRGQDMTDRRVRSRRRASPSAEPEGPQVISSPAEAAELPSGTRFLTPDGREKIVP